MSSRLWWSALGLCAYLAFALAMLPAATVYRWFAPDALRLSGISGSVWHGRAALGSVPGLPVHGLQWQLDAWPLLLGRIVGHVDARLPDGFVNADATVSRGRIVLRNLRASTSLPTLSKLLPIRGTRGLVSLSLDRLRLLNGFPAAVVGTVRIDKLRVAPLVAGKNTGLIPLGNYIVKFGDASGSDAAVAATIHDTGGPLEVDATLRLTKDRHYKLDGRLRPRADASGELVQGLNLMTGSSDAKGFRPFNLDGSL